jgi:hypothetical protein
MEIISPFKIDSDSVATTAPEACDGVVDRELIDVIKDEVRARHEDDILGEREFAAEVLFETAIARGEARSMTLPLDEGSEFSSVFQERYIKKTEFAVTAVRLGLSFRRLFEYVLRIRSVMGKQLLDQRSM